MKFKYEKIHYVYLLSFALFCFAVLIGDYTTISEVIPGYVITTFKYFSLFLITFKVLYFDVKTYTYEEKVKIILLLIIISLITFFSKNRTFIQYFLIIIGAKNIEFKKIIKCLFYVELFSVVIVLLLSIGGIIPNYIYMRTNASVDRYSMGFKDFKYFSTFMWSLSMYYLYLKYSSLNIKDYIGLFLINIIVFYFTNSRNELLCSILMIFLILIVKLNHNKKIDRWVYLFSKYSGFLFSGIMFFLSLIYMGTNPLLKFINKLASGRLNYGRRAIYRYGISIFGTHVEWIGLASINKGIALMTDYNFVDCSYIKVLLEYGIVGFFLIIGGLYFVAKQQEKNKNISINALLLIVLIHSILDPQLFTILFNGFLILIVDVVFEDSNIAHENKNNKFINENVEKIDGKNLMSLKEIQKTEIEMLEVISYFCEKHDINYYLCGGSLLGAIRHKGFIPWDDDIDILMPREDFNKFLDLTSKEKISDALKVCSLKYKSLNDPFCKVMNLNTVMEKHYIDDEHDCHLWLDIFPMDGFPKSDLETKIVFKLVHTLRQLNVILKAKGSIIENESKSEIKKIFKTIIRIILSPIKPRMIAKIIDLISCRYSFKDSEYVGGIAWGYGPQEKLMKSKVKNTKVKFENISVNTFSCWDEYLSNLYGEYMVLPDEDKRIIHHMKVYKTEGREINE